MSPLDSVFLMTESREHPMHVGGLQLFEPPEGAGPDYVREAHDALVANRDFQPTFRKHPAWTFGGLPNVAWTYDDPDDVEVEYHVRRSALPTPGRVRELLELTSRWHSGLLDRHRPLWEAHFVEGLNDGRFALYSKFHHSLIDGVSALRLMQRTLSPDPDDTDMQAIWDLPRRRRDTSEVEAAESVQVGGIRGGIWSFDVVAGPRRARGTAADVAVRRAAHHVQRADRWCATGCRPVVGD